jgi:hypothetical protein
MNRPIPVRADTCVSMPTGQRDTPPSELGIVMAIREGVADARGEEVSALPPLETWCDPGALATFIESSEAPTQLILRIYDCWVEIDGDGEVTVTSSH